MEPQTESTEPWVKTNEQFPHYYERETADGDRETVFRTDAAQGMLWHSYKRNADGKVVLHVFHTPDAPKLTTRAEVSPTADLPDMESGPACPANNKRKRSVRVSYDVRTKSGKTVRGSAKPTVKVSAPAEIKRFAKKARSK